MNMDAYDARRLILAGGPFPPEGLSVGGDLYLRGTAITALPEGLSVGGGLDLRGTAITALPEGLSVGGDLYLRGTAITALPEGLSVGGGLDLSETAITALPEGLSVGGDLYLRGTAITALPEGLSVGGGLYLSETAITALPEGLSVGGDLDLRGTAITALPEGLSVGGGLYLRGSKVVSWSNLKVRGHDVAEMDAANQRIAAIARIVLARPESLRMSDWHHCDTVHCVSGWGIHNEGNAGYALQSMVGPETAGIILLGPEAASHFHDSNEAALAWLASKVEGVPA